MGETVNRYLDDKAMDHIDHALGRPVDPMADTYREYFATDRRGVMAAEFRRSPYWVEGNGTGDMAFFYVTQEGRRALAEHLRAIGDPHRTFTVTFNGYESTVVSTTRGKARYQHFLQVSDCMPDLSFAEFCRRSNVAVTTARGSDG